MQTFIVRLGRLMAYAEMTVGWVWMIVGALMVYIGVYNRSPLPAGIGDAVRVPVAMAGASIWLVRTGIRLSLGGPKKAKAPR